MKTKLFLKITFTQVERNTLDLLEATFDENLPQAFLEVLSIRAI